MVKLSCYRVGVLGSLCLVQILRRSMVFYCKGVAKGMSSKVSLDSNLFQHVLALQPPPVSYLTACDLVLSCVAWDNGGILFAGRL